MLLRPDVLLSRFRAIQRCAEAAAAMPKLVSIMYTGLKRTNAMHQWETDAYSWDIPSPDVSVKGVLRR